jgi:hypothetical protein
MKMKIDKDINRIKTDIRNYANKKKNTLIHGFRGNGNANGMKSIIENLTYGRESKQPSKTLVAFGEKIETKLRL